MSNKTEVLSFDKWMVDAESWSDRDCYEAGQQSKQAEIEDLQKRVKELELINFDSELHFDAAKEHIDHLQKIIDLAYKNISHEQWCDECGDYQTPVFKLINILKGD